MPDVASRELWRDAVARAAELPEELGHREELLELHAPADVNAVDAQRRQLTEELLVGLSIDARGHAVEEHVTANDIDAKHIGLVQVRRHEVTELFQLLPDHRVSGRICARQSPQAGESFQDGERIERGGRL